jgi:hypothetical protein
LLDRRLYLPGQMWCADPARPEAAGMPEQWLLRSSWGSEMCRHNEATGTPGIAVDVLRPAEPWQRGLNGNTNSPLCQYFPKSTDLSVHSAMGLAAVAAELSSRSRKTLGRWISAPPAPSAHSERPGTGPV